LRRGGPSERRFVLEVLVGEGFGRSSHATPMVQGFEFRVYGEGSTMSCHATPMRIWGMEGGGGSRGWGVGGVGVWGLGAVTPVRQ
jgi:hypothetical protein